MKPAESTDKSDDRQSVKDPQSNNAQTAQHSEREGDAMDPATMSTCTVVDKHHSYRMFPSFRFAVGIMLAAAFFCATSMRADLGMAMVCMVNATAFTPDKPVNWTKNIDKSGVCQADGTTDNMVNAGYNGHLLWTPAMQSTLFSATYYGGLVTVLPGGILADRFSPKIILMIAIADYVLISALTPLLVNVNYYAFFAARILMGFGEGLVLPTMSSLAARWFPQTERSTIAAIYTSGNQVATSSISVIGSALCTADFLGGWPSIFYCLAIVGVVWIVLWYLLVSSSPDESRWASKREKRYLSTYVENTDKQLMVINSIPWLSIALSAPMIADLLSTFAANYTATMFQAFLPTFYKEVLFVDLHKNGWFTTAPFITQLISKNIMGIISDKLKRSSVLSPTVACKIFQVSGCVIQSSTLLVISFLVDCTTPTLAIAMVVIQGIGAAAVIPGSMTSLISLAPNYTGTLISISMIFGQIANMAAPNVVALVKRKGTAQEWSTVFLIAGVMNAAVSIIFLIFGSADEQEWAKSKRTGRAHWKGARRQRRISSVSAYELH